MITTKLTSILTGFFKLDGGAMFGIVPRRMWEKMNPPDEKNLCTWALRCLLVETSDRKILIDTGIGTKQDDKFRSHFEPHNLLDFRQSLAPASLAPEDITDVFFTHLHFDHCGGALLTDEDGRAKPAFPNATFWTNRRHFDWAMQPNDRERASFLKENFLPLYEMGRLQFVEVRQNVAFCPHFSVLFAHGHTEAMMLPKIDTPAGTLLFCADLLPARWHVGMPYVMAYDIRPLQTLKEKARWLTEAVRKNWILFLEHDPAAACCTLQKDEKGRMVLKQVGELEDFLP